MTPSDFRALLRDLALNDHVIGWMTGSTPRQVHRWKTGATPVPQTVSLLLLAYQSGSLTPRWFVEHLGPPQ